MALQDVSHDPSVVNWLRQSGHGHLLDDRHQSTNYPSSAPAPIYSNDYRSSDPYSDLYQRSTSFAGAENFGSQPYDAQYKRDNFMRSSAQFLAPHASQPQYDIDVEVIKLTLNLRTCRIFFIIFACEFTHRTYDVIQIRVLYIDQHKMMSYINKE